MRSHNLFIEALLTVLIKWFLRGTCHWFYNLVRKQGRNSSQHDALLNWISFCNGTVSVSNGKNEDLWCNRIWLVGYDTSFSGSCCIVHVFVSKTIMKLKIGFTLR